MSDRNKYNGCTESWRGSSHLTAMIISQAVAALRTFAGYAVKKKNFPFFNFESLRAA